MQRRTLKDLSCLFRALIGDDVVEIVDKAK